MKKFAAFIVLAIAIAIPAASIADPAPETDLGAVHAHQNGNGGELYAEGATGNPDPLDGYAGVEGDLDSQSLTVYCSDEGSWNDQDNDGTPDSEDTDPGQEREVCDPAP